MINTLSQPATMWSTAQSSPAPKDWQWYFPWPLYPSLHEARTAPLRENNKEPAASPQIRRWKWFLQTLLGQGHLTWEVRLINSWSSAHKVTGGCRGKAQSFSRNNHPHPEGQAAGTSLDWPRNRDPRVLAPGGHLLAL